MVTNNLGNAMELPYKPKSVFHRMGGKVVEITSIGHRTEKPEDGRSRDYWFFTGSVLWDDAEAQRDHTMIEMGSVCADTPEGHAEINGLADLMMEYLNTHGVWCDKGPHEGWYAHREKRRAA